MVANPHQLSLQEPTADAHTWELPAHLSAAEVDAKAAEIAADLPAELRLDLRHFRRSRLFADARLLGLLALMRRRKVPVIASMVASQESRLNVIPKKHEELFHYLLTGLILSWYCRSIHTTLSNRTGLNLLPQIRAEQNTRIARNDGLLSYGKESCAALIDQFRAPPPASFLSSTMNTDMQAHTQFRDGFKDRILSGLNVPIAQRDLDAISRFAFQAFQNTQDHASMSLDGRSLRGTAFLLARRINLREEPLESLIGDEAGPVEQFLSELEPIFGRGFAKRGTLAEITVGDAGEGIPGTLARSLSIYGGPIAAEEGLFRSAVLDRLTTKPSSDPGAGLGLKKMLDATRWINGLIVFRTGRLFMYQHFVGQRKNVAPHDFARWGSTDYPLVAGTAVSLLIPMSRRS